MNRRSNPVGHTIIVLAALLLVAAAWYAPLQRLADAQTDAGLQRAVVTFASARVLNGLISVVQGTEFSAQPLGVGVTLTLGQILDPINDLIEQFSSLMLFASVAFGVQKMLLAIGGHWAVSAAVTVVALAWAALALAGRRPPWLTRLVLILMMIRLAMPLATIGSDFAFRQLMASDYEAGQQSLLATSQRLEGLQAESGGAGTPAPGAEATPPASPGGWVERLKKRYDDIRQGVAARLPDVDAIRRAADELPERVITLIVIFLMQTVALPLLLVWGLYALSFGAAFGGSNRSPRRR